MFIKNVFVVVLVVLQFSDLHIHCCLKCFSFKFGSKTEIILVFRKGGGGITDFHEQFLVKNM